MALIRCEDCGHKVSHLAFVCPMCARPMAAQQEAAKALPAAQGSARVTRLRSAPSPRDATPAPRAQIPTAPTAKPEGDGPRPERIPTALAGWQDELRLARESAKGVTKRCRECDVDVALDNFRARSGDGYLCGDCQDLVVLERLEQRIFFGRMLRIAALVAALCVVAGTSFYVVTSLQLSSSKARKR